MPELKNNKRTRHDKIDELGNLMKFWQILDKFLDRFFVVLGAFLGSQIPEFLQQYVQRLAGHVDELKYIIDQLSQLASASNKSLEQYIQKFVHSSDLDFVKQGEFMQALVTRWQNLNDSLRSLAQSSYFERPFVFLKEMNYPIAQETFYSYQAGINLTLEGLGYTAIGIIVGILLYQLISKIFKFGSQRVASFFRPRD